MVVVVLVPVGVSNNKVSWVRAASVVSTGNCTGVGVDVSVGVRGVGVNIDVGGDGVGVGARVEVELDVWVGTGLEVRVGVSTDNCNGAGVGAGADAGAGDGDGDGNSNGDSNRDDDINRDGDSIGVVTAAAVVVVVLCSGTFEVVKVGVIVMPLGRCGVGGLVNISIGIGITAASSKCVLCVPAGNTIASVIGNAVTLTEDDVVIAVVATVAAAKVGVCDDTDEAVVETDSE